MYHRVQLRVVKPSQSKAPLLMLIILIVAHVLFDMGCSNDCQDRFIPGRPINVDISQWSGDEHVLRGAWHALTPLGYKFRVEHDSAAIKVLDLPENPDYILGLTSWDNGTIQLAVNAPIGVVMHEFLHMLGVWHIDEETNPGCHIMNAYYCGADQLTPEDIDLYNNRSLDCNNGYRQ